MYLFSRDRLPMLYQTTATECGLACLAMISCYHGLKIDVATLRSRFAASLLGLTLLDIQQIAQKLQLSSRAIRTRVSSLKEVALPALLFWNERHFVVLKEVRKKSAVIHDPAIGAIHVAWEDFEQSFSGVAMEFFPTPEFVAHDQREKSSVWSYFSGFPDLWVSVRRVIWVSLALEVFGALTPLFTQLVVDDVLVSGDLRLLTTLLVAYLCIVVCQSITSLLRSRLLMRFGITMNARMQLRVFSQLLMLPPGFFEARSLGDIMSRYQALHEVQRTLTTSFAEAVIDGIMAIVTLAIIFAYSPKLASIALAFVSVYALVRFARYLPQRLAGERLAIAEARVSSHFLETVRGMRQVQLFRRQLVRKNQWLSLLFDSYGRAAAVGKLDINYSEIGSFLAAVERGLILFIGAQLVLSGAFTIGFLLAFVAYKDQFVGRIDRIIQRIVDLGLLRVQLDRIRDIVETTALDDESEHRPEPERFDLEFRNVGFRYAVHDRWIVRRLSFKIEQGEHVAIVGRSGVGKSTIAKLALRVLQPEEGSVLLGNVDVSNLGSSLYGIVACVMQGDALFAGSILENITFFATDPDIAKVERCARIAEMHDEILCMKMAYQTVVTDLGSSLSGGQRQRLLIARALYADPKILVLDESTSELDVDLEQRIAANLKQLSITRISIAHRPQTIAACDRKIVIDTPTEDRS